jgi:hypothetical protein
MCWDCGNRIAAESNNMAVARLDGTSIDDWTSFHEACKVAFGFPDFYDCNMDAWVDCLSYLRDDDGMCKFRLAPDEVLRIEILHADALRAKMPDLLDELAFCIDMLNDRYCDYGEKPALELVLAG